MSKDEDKKEIKRIPLVRLSEFYLINTQKTDQIIVPFSIRDWYKIIKISKPACLFKYKDQIFFIYPFGGGEHIIVFKPTESLNIREVLKYLDQNGIYYRS